MLSHFKLCYKATVCMAHMSRHRSMRQNPEINPHIYAQVIYNRGAKNIQWEKDSLFNKWCWEKWTCKEWNETTVLHHIQKSTQNGNWTEDLKPLKLLEENTGLSSLTLFLTNEFFELDIKSKNQKQKKKVELQQTKKLLHHQQTKWKGNLQNGTKYLHIYLPIRG